MSIITFFRNLFTRPKNARHRHPENVRRGRKESPVYRSEKLTTSGES